MLNRLKIILIFIIFLFSAVSCQTIQNKNSSTSSNNSSQKQKNSNYLSCSDPRPQMCTKEFRPVCADVDTKVRCVTAPCPSNIRKTVSNGCTACSDSNIYGYSLGACEE